MTRVDYETSVPALLLMIGEHAWDYGALATVRTLGRVGIAVYVALRDTDHPVTSSKYVTGVVEWSTTGEEPEDELVAGIRRACATVGRAAVAIAGDDESAVLLARRRADLDDVLLLPTVAPDLPDRLADKAALAALCQSLGTPAPRTIAPTTSDEVRAFAKTAPFPLVVKNPEPFTRLVARAVPATTKVETEAELDSLLTDWTPGRPLVIQEFIPQATSQDWYVAATLTDDHVPAVAFSGLKLRAYPDATGVGTLSESRYNSALVDIAQDFCQKVGYAGVCDMDWRFDERDGQFKLLDFNPRRGAQFRTFRSTADIDVVRALHLVLTGRSVPPGRQVDGVRHVVGVLDQKAYLAQRGTPTTTGHGPVQAWGSERAWWAADDPWPWFTFVRQLGPVRRVVGTGAPESAAPAASEEWRSLVLREPPPIPLDKPGPPRPMKRWRAQTADHARPVLVTVAQNQSATIQLAHESAACSWAADSGVPVPQLVGQGPGWLIAEFIDSRSPEGSDYVAASLAAAQQIRSATTPPPASVSTWKGSRRSMPQRVIRALIGRLPMREFRQVRSEAALLPADALVHGDFSNANVMHAATGVRVIDWEFVGNGILGTDEVRLWSTLEHRSDRDLLLESFLATVSPERLPDIGLLIHWLALRQLAENLAAPRKHQNPANIALAHTTLTEARKWRQLLEAR